MFCYDGFLTYVLIVKCALLADLCTDSKARNQLNTFSAWFELLGSSLALLGYYFFDEDNLGPFRKICWVMSSLAALAWYMSGKMMLMPKTVSYLPVKADECDPLDFPIRCVKGFPLCFRAHTKDARALLLHKHGPRALKSSVWGDGVLGHELKSPHARSALCRRHVFGVYMCDCSMASPVDKELGAAQYVRG